VAAAARAGALVLLSLVLGACAQALPRSFPGFPLPHSMLPTAAKDAVPASGKLTLAGAYQLALARSERVALAERAVADADIDWSEKSTEMAPTLDATATAYEQRERVIGGVVFTPGQQFIGAVTLDQPLFRKGYFDSRAGGKHRYDSARAALARERQLLAHDVAAAYIDVLKFRRLLELAHTSVTRATSQRTFAAGRVKAGQALKNAELLAVIDVKRAERQEVNAQRDLAAAEVAFERIVGRPPPADLERPAMPTLPERANGLELAKRRGDLAALELGVDAAEDEEAAAAGKRVWPRLDVNANVQYLNPDVLDTTFNWQIIGVLTVPLFQGGREYTELSRRENATHVAQLQLDQSTKAVVEEVELASLQTQTAARASELAKEELDAAKEHYELVDKQVRLGAITFLEVTNAQAVLVEAENAYEAATIDKLRAAYDYLYAIGALELK